MGGEFTGHQWPVPRKMFPFDDVIILNKILVGYWVRHPFINRAILFSRRRGPVVCKLWCMFYTVRGFVGKTAPAGTVMTPPPHEDHATPVRDLIDLMCQAPTRPSEFPRLSFESGSMRGHYGAERHAKLIQNGTHTGEAISMTKIHLCSRIMSYGTGSLMWRQNRARMRKSYVLFIVLRTKNRTGSIMWYHYRQATGLDAWASRVKCPARFVSHLHDICIYMSCL